MQDTIDLKLFDADAGTAQAPTTAQEGAALSAGAADSAPKGGAGEGENETAAAEDKAKRFRALIRGEFREQYAEETQKLINRRFRETEALRRQLKELLERDGAAGDARSAGAADSAPGGGAEEGAGAEAGEALSVGSADSASKGGAEEAEEAAARKAEAHAFAAYQAARWAREAEALRAREPDFDLDAMRADPTFVLLLTHGVGLERAWRACTSEQRARAAAVAAEQAVLADIRARGARPSEAGGGVSAAAARSDVSRLSDAEVLDVLARLARRERVSFG